MMWFLYTFYFFSKPCPYEAKNIAIRTRPNTIKIRGRGNRGIWEERTFADDRWKNDCRTQLPCYLRKFNKITFVLLCSLILLRLWFQTIICYRSMDYIRNYIACLAFSRKHKKDYLNFVLDFIHGCGLSLRTDP